VETIAKSGKDGVFIAHEIADEVTMDKPVGIFVTPNKLFRVDEFIEESYREDDAYFFSLGDDATGFAPADDSPSLDAAINVNMVYDENGIFVGPPTVNLWPDKTLLHGFIGDGDVSSVLYTPAGANQCVNLKKTLSGDSFSSLNAANIIAYSGVGKYSVSAYIRHSDGSTPSAIPSGFVLAQGAGGASITNTLIKKEPATDIISTQWHRVTRTADYTGASTLMVPLITWDDVSTTDAEYRLYGMQMEKLEFPTPFTDSSRSAQQLAFNLNADISLDWSEPWTILYWKKPIGTSQGLTGYSVESLGRNGNSVGGGYDYWGKINASNTLDLKNGTVESGIANFSWDDYQYNWHLVIVRYNGSETKLNIFGVNTSPVVMTRAGVIPSSDYYVNQNGYDFQLGGFDLGQQPAAYYRGLTIYKKELTDEYVTKYYDTKLKIFNKGDGLTIYSGIILEEDL